MQSSFQQRIAEVYKREFVDKTQPYLNKIFSLFKNKQEDWNNQKYEGGHSENRKKYFEKNRTNDIVNIVGRSCQFLNSERKLKILDLGCGFGEFSSIFRGFGHDVYSLNGGPTWYLDDFRFVAHKILELNYRELDLFDIPPGWAGFDYIFASEILTLESLINRTDEIFNKLFLLAKDIVVILHKGTVLNYNSEVYYPQIHTAVADHINIITFYSDKNYKQLAINLKHSGKKFGYHIYSTPVNNFRNWAKAVSEKPRLIHKYYNKFGSPLLYLDADCEIIKPLHELVSLIKANDLCVRERNLSDRYNLGVMGFGCNGKRLRPFLHDWASLTKLSMGASQTVDQKPFSHILHEKHTHLKVHNIGPYYNFLPADHLQFNKEEAVILHHKESKTNPLAKAWREQYFRKDV